MQCQKKVGAQFSKLHKSMRCCLDVREFLKVSFIIQRKNFLPDYKIKVNAKCSSTPSSASALKQQRRGKPQTSKARQRKSFFLILIDAQF